MIPRFTPFIARLQHSTSRALFLEKKFTDGNLTDGDQNKTLIKKKRPSIRETQKYKILLVLIINNIYYRKGTGQKPKKGYNSRMRKPVRIEMNKSSATVSNHPIPAKHSAS